MKPFTLPIRTLFAPIILGGSLLCTLPSHASKQSYSPPVQTEADFQAWLQGFKQQAQAKGIAPDLLNSAFSNVHLNERVLELDRQQPEFTQTFWQYFNRAVTPWRIQQGKKLLQKHHALLSEVTKKYGVPERVLVAFWALETNFGGYTGNLPIFESLATLSYDPRRSAFFTQELYAALSVLSQNHLTTDDMRGSWAGAMGQCQFMPSNYLRYAVDGDADQSKNLWKSLPDVFHSMGNFLQQLGWQAAENWGREVQLPKGFDYQIADGKTIKPLSYWQAQGIKLADGRTLPSADMQAALLLPYNASGPAFLVFNNFYVIKRWNNSNNYAIAVGHLADRLVGRNPLTKTAPLNDQALSAAEIKEIQARLKLAGFAPGNTDGIAGMQTKEAIRHYQHQHQLVADGFVSYPLLMHLRKNKPSAQ